MDALNAPAIPVRKVKLKKPAKPSSPTTNKVQIVVSVFKVCFIFTVSPQLLCVHCQFTVL